MLSCRVLVMRELKQLKTCFFQFDNDITRFLNLSGMNRTATGSINSKASEKRETKGKTYGKIGIHCNELATNRGNYSMERTCNKTTKPQRMQTKTPYELYDELGICTPKLSYIQLCELCGTAHQRKLTINGLTIEQPRNTYTYFPPIETSEQRDICRTYIHYNTS
jgi:hypothetical protein